MKILSLETAKTFKEVDMLVEYYNSQNKIIETEDPVYTEKQIEELLETNSSLIREIVNYRICKLVGAENFEGFCEGIKLMTENIMIETRYMWFSSYRDYLFTKCLFESYKETRNRIRNIKYNIQKEAHAQKLEIYKNYVYPQQLKESLIPRFFKLIEDEIKKYYKEVNTILKKLDKKIEDLEIDLDKEFEKLCIGGNYE